jgi:hypothetical protein
MQQLSSIFATDLSHNSLKVGQIRKVINMRHAVGTNNRVYFFLCLSQDIRVSSHNENKAGQKAGGCIGSGSQHVDAKVTLGLKMNN